MKQPLTPWFPPHIKPARPGVYQTRFLCHAPGYSYWDGWRWGNQRTTADYAKNLAGPISVADQYKTWRGLAQKP